MGSLRLQKLSYSGDKYTYESPCLDENIVIIEGPNGSGKSTFFDLIYYGLGGKVDQFSKTSKFRHEEITSDSNSYVELSIRLNENFVKLVRNIGENKILVVEDGGDKKLFPIYRSASEDFVFSDWLLERLGIDVFEITQGSNTFKVNFHDLTRLIYHNQNTDPGLIYKPAQNTSFVSDSLYVRRAIFEILIGKSLVEYYKNLSALKKAEKEHSEARSLYSEYTSLVSELSGEQEVKNLEFINREIVEKEDRLEELLELRRESVKVLPAPIDAIDDIDSLKSDKRNAQFKIDQAESRYKALTVELSRVLQGRKHIQIDIDRISKIILTHEQLELFSPDTCPYCLSEVERVTNKCVCGSEVNEAEYQRFFYSSSEYNDILKSKLKSLESVNAVISDINQEIDFVKASLEKRKNNLRVVDIKLEETLSLMAVEVDFPSLESIDQKILEIKEDLASLSQLQKLESKLESYSDRLRSKKDKLDSVRRDFSRSDNESQEQLKQRVKDFSKIYNGLMKKSLANVRTAEIDSDTYLPLINNGLYREASAGVSVRFLYYLTFLQMSMDNEIPYPRFLMIDTPETAGIDQSNLNAVMENVEELDRMYEEQFQAIIATGVGKYPDSMSQNVRIKLSCNEKLLRPVT